MKGQKKLGNSGVQQHHPIHDFKKNLPFAPTLELHHPICTSSTRRWNPWREWCWCLQVLGPFSAEKSTALNLWKPCLAPQHKVVISGVRDPNKWPKINGYIAGVTGLLHSRKNQPYLGVAKLKHLAKRACDSSIKTRTTFTQFLQPYRTVPLKKLCLCHENQLLPHG